jgi:hypothetical protein
MKNSRFGISELLENNKEEVDKLVEISVGQLRDLAFVIRDQAINLKKSVNEDDVRQVRYRLERLYKELTNHEINDFKI